MEDRANGLEGQCQELEPTAQQVEILRSQRDRLVQENASLTTEMELKKEELEKTVCYLKEESERLDTQIQVSQRLIGELGRRFLDREEELRQVQHRLAEATRAIGQLADLGLPMDQLPNVAARLSWQARHQGMDATQFIDWFFYCLEGAGSLLGLESQVKEKRKQLQEVDRELLKVTKQRDVVSGEFIGLSRQFAEAKASRRSMAAAWKQEMHTIAETIQQEVAQGGEELRALAKSLEKEVRVRQLQLTEMAVTLGRLQEAVDSYALVRPLVSLLQGQNQLSLSEARVAATALCLGLLGYLEANDQIPASSALVGHRAKYLLEALEKWRP